MEYSENNINPDKNAVAAENTSSVSADADGSVAPLSHSSDHDNADTYAPSAFEELFGIAIKAVAVTVAFILLLTSVLAVCLPLYSMRVYNKLGFTARAVDFGERYIARELSSHNADGTDDRGNYKALAATPELTNDDFTEALYVCINNSYKLMNDRLKSGDDPAQLEYYAERTEKYTRMFLSLNGVGGVITEKSAENMAAFPLAEMKSAVYNYGHTVRNMNYRAKAVSGNTDAMLWSSNEDGNIVTTLTERTNTLAGIDLRNASRDNIIYNVDMYIDYIGALGEYIDVELIRAGVENDPVKKLRYYNKQNKEWTEDYVCSESFVQNVYTNVLSGDEFSLFLSKQNGFTALYSRLQRFTEFAQAAVDFKPDDRNNNKRDEMLHQLYWLQTLSSASYKLWYLDYLLYYNREMFGATSSAINDNYGNLVRLNSVEYEGVPAQISQVFAKKANEFKTTFNV